MVVRILFSIVQDSLMWRGASNEAEHEAIQYEYHAHRIVSGCCITISIIIVMTIINVQQQEEEEEEEEEEEQ